MQQVDELGSPGLGMLLSSLSSLAPIIGFGVWKGMLLRSERRCYENYLEVLVRKRSAKIKYCLRMYFGVFQPSVVFKRISAMIQNAFEQSFLSSNFSNLLDAAPGQPGKGYRHHYHHQQHRQQARQLTPVPLELQEQDQLGEDEQGEYVQGQQQKYAAGQYHHQQNQEAPQQYQGYQQQRYPRQLAGYWSRPRQYHHSAE